MENVNNMNEIIHPWRNKDKSVILYDLFSADVIPCLSVNKYEGLCVGDDCQLAHINDSYNKSIEYGNKYKQYIECARQTFKNWNHMQYILFIHNKMN